MLKARRKAEVVWEGALALEPHGYVTDIDEHGVELRVAATFEGVRP